MELCFWTSVGTKIWICSWSMKYSFPSFFPWGCEVVDDDELGEARERRKRVRKAKRRPTDRPYRCYLPHLYISF